MKTSVDETTLARLASLIDGVVWHADPSRGVNTFVSPTLTSVLGYNPQQWMEPGFWESRLHPDDRDRVLTDADRLIAAQEPYALEYRILHANGQVVWLRDLTTPVFRDGQLAELGGVMLDITAQKTAEAALRASESRFRALVRNSSDALTVVNRGGFLLYVSPAMDVILGYDSETLVGENILDFMHPDEQGEIRAAFAEVGDEGNHLRVVVEGQLALVDDQQHGPQTEAAAVGEVAGDLAFGADVPREAAEGLVAAGHVGGEGADVGFQVGKVVGFVASDPSFTAQPGVVNGASHLLGDVFGDAGVHARSAVGVAVLPLDAPVEVEITVAVRD